MKYSFVKDRPYFAMSLIKWQIKTFVIKKQPAT